jgi:hypothetical protein
LRNELNILDSRCVAWSLVCFGCLLQNIVVYWKLFWKSFCENFNLIVLQNLFSYH